MAQRYSKKREAIITALQGTTTHPSAEWIYLQLKDTYPDLSLGTVYRNLSQLKEQGKILSLGYVNGVERFDYNTAPHVHFVCGKCGDVQDLHGMEVPIQLCEDAARELGAVVEQCELTFHGLCNACAGEEYKEEIS